MFRHSVNKGLELDFQIPELTQRALEAYFAKARAVEDELALANDDAIHSVARILRDAVEVIIDERLRPTSPEFSGRLLAVATSAVRAARHLSPHKLSGLETDGIYARAALELGWLGDLSLDEITDEPHSGARVKFIIAELNQAIEEALRIPPN